MPPRAEILLGGTVHAKVPFMRTTLDLPDDVFRRLTAHAALRGKTLRELFLELTLRELNPTDGPRAANGIPMGRRDGDFVD